MPPAISTAPLGGGAYNYGTVFELTPATGGGWTEKMLHNFANGTDGYHPHGGLIFDAAGNLYGTTSVGGAYSYGTVFELTPQRAEAGRRRCCITSTSARTGPIPRPALIFDAAGNLYGTTFVGGDYFLRDSVPVDARSGRRLDEKVLHSFNNDGRGRSPSRPDLRCRCCRSCHGVIQLSGGGARR